MVGKQRAAVIKNRRIPVHTPPPPCVETTGSALSHTIANNRVAVWRKVLTTVVRKLAVSNAIIYAVNVFDVTNFLRLQKYHKKLQIAAATPTT